MNPPGSEISIVLADDHNLIRTGLRRLLEREPDLRVIGEASQAAEAARLVADRRPDVLVLDLQMPGADPRTDVPRLRAEQPATAIVVLTMSDDPRLARDLMRRGASAYVLKQAAEQHLGAAIRAAGGGGSYVDPALGAAMARLGEDPLAGLGDRERELLRLIALGHSNREIADLLFLSVRAIEVNRAKLMTALDVSSRPELVRIAIEQQLIG